MENDWNLSEKIEPDSLLDGTKATINRNFDVIPVEDVKEFIKRLKEIAEHKATYTIGWTKEEQEAYSKGLEDCKLFLLEQIDKLCGEKLK